MTLISHDPYNPEWVYLRYPKAPWRVWRVERWPRSPWPKVVAKGATDPRGAAPKHPRLRPLLRRAPRKRQGSSEIRIMQMVPFSRSSYWILFLNQAFFQRFWGRLEQPKAALILMLSFERKSEFLANFLSFFTYFYQIKAVPTLNLIWQKWLWVFLAVEWWAQNEML